MSLETMTVFGFANDMLSMANDRIGMYRYFNQPNSAELMY